MDQVSGYARQRFCVCFAKGSRAPAVRRRAALLLLVLAAAALPLAAQYPPGPYPPGPYPPGSYPPGQDPSQYPGGAGGGIGLPRLGRKKPKQNNGSGQSQDDPNAIHVEGTVDKIDAGSMVLRAADSRLFNLKITSDTKFVKAADPATGSDKQGSSSGDSSGSSSPSSSSKQSGDTKQSAPPPAATIERAAVQPGALVMITAVQDQEGNYTATRIALEQPAVATMSNPTGNSNDRPDDSAGSNTPMVTRAPPEDPNRPHLTRGAKQGRPEEKDDTPEQSQPYEGVTFEKAKPADSGVAFETDSGKPAPKVDEKMVPLDKTREWLATLTSSLPNFVCSQLTTRYMLQSKSSGWQPIDMVGAEVVYENGKEDYRKITINGKATNKSMMDIGGSRSTGEYATTLYALFYEGTRTRFKYNGPARTAGKETIAYDFSVDRPNSGWDIARGGQSITPGYSGTIWIEKATGHVLRVEMQADDIPKSFPLDKVEMTVEYDMVRLSGESTFLLPVHSENLACERGTPYCSRNAIDFRNYHKFGSESTIVFQ